MSAIPGPAPSASNSAVVRITTGPLVGPVLSRVVGMLAARADCPVDRLDNALLVVDALAAHGAEHVPDHHLTVRVSADQEALELRVGPLNDDGAEGLLRDSSLPGVGNVLERVADAVSIDETDGGAPLLSIRIGLAA